jgi:nucleotide-binding universal stress UspA family protein
MRKILAAVDGSPEHVRVLETTAGLAARFGAEVHVVSVGGVEGGWRLAFGKGSGAARDYLREDARNILQKACAEMASLGVECTTHEAAGPVSREIASLAGTLGVDLIVIGHRNLDWVDRIVEDSVGASLLSCAPCNVMVVIRPSE